MPICPIIQLGDPLLREKCVPVENPASDEIKELVQDLQATLAHWLSELVQHEIDHLDGILAIDRVFDVKTICTREEFEKRYRDRSPYATVPVRIKH